MNSKLESQTTLALMEPAKFGSWSSLHTTSPTVAAGESATATTSASSAVISKESSNSDSCLKELDYIGLAEVSSARSGNNNEEEDDNSTGLKLEDTDLRLGLAPPVKEDANPNPRVQSPPVELELLGPKESKDSCSENATGTPKSAHMAFMNVFSPASMLPASAAKNGIKRVYIDALGESVSAANNPVPQTSLATKQTQGSESKPLQESSFAPKWAAEQNNCEVEPPPAKDRVVGWPPVRSYRKNALASAHAGHANNEGESQSTIYVKVNMDGTPIGRKVDLNAYRSYECLVAALEEMFHSPSNGHGLHFLKNSEFVLTYEDKEGDWMLVGDVPWGMFVNTVRRLRIVRPSEAIGVAPRAGKCRV